MLTKEMVVQALPPNLKSAATQEFTDRINNIVNDPVVADQIRDNFISYASVLKDGRFKTEDYLHAVVYVSHKLMGLSNQDAYARTFPARMQTLIAKGTSGKDISAYVHAYHKNKMVGMLLEQTLTPFWVLNQDAYQKAINTQFELMTDPDVSPKVRSDAANSIMTHLKPPEAKEVNLNVGLKESSGLSELKTALEVLAKNQVGAIQSGTPTKLIAATPLVEAEFTEVDPA